MNERENGMEEKKEKDRDDFVASIDVQISGDGKLRRSIKLETNKKPKPSSM